MSKVKFTVHNMVISVEFSDRIDLPKLAEKLDGAEYIPEEFPGLVYKIKSPKTSFLIFSSGKMNCTGARSLEEAQEAIKNVLIKLEHLGIKVRKPKIVIQNIVASANLNKNIDLDKVLQLEGTEYEPEVFPGLTYRIRSRVAFLIFGSGKVVCVGARSIKEIKESFDYLITKLRRIGAIKRR